MAPEPPPPVFSGDFIQLSVVADAPSIGPALIAGTEPGQPTKLSSGQKAATAAKTRPGLIEIELPDGNRLRVDAFVNERALHRVMSVLKATS